MRGLASLNQAILEKKPWSRTIPLLTDPSLPIIRYLNMQ